MIAIVPDNAYVLVTVWWEIFCLEKIFTFPLPVLTDEMFIP